MLRGLYKWLQKSAATCHGDGPAGDALAEERRHRGREPAGRTPRRDLVGQLAVRGALDSGADSQPVVVQQS